MMRYEILPLAVKHVINDYTPINIISYEEMKSEILQTSRLVYFMQQFLYVFSFFCIMYYYYFDHIACFTANGILTLIFFCCRLV